MHCQWLTLRSAKATRPALLLAYLHFCGNRLNMFWTSCCFLENLISHLVHSTSMRGLFDFFKSMYVVTIALTLALSAIASYNSRVFPASFAIAVAACCILDLLAMKLFVKKGLKFPYSVCISGIIIGSLAPIDAPIAAILTGALVAVVSKHLVKLKSRHVFNPATLGLLVSLSAFRLGDVWWAASQTGDLPGIIVPLSLFLAIANYRAGKLMVSLPFLGVVSILYFATGAIEFSGFSSLAVLISSLPYYFAFIMLSEPKTSPNMPKEQIVFGITVALAYTALEVSGVTFPFFIALLAGNLAYALYRNSLFSAKQARANAPQ